MVGRRHTWRFDVVNFKFPRIRFTQIHLLAIGVILCHGIQFRALSIGQLLFVFFCQRKLGQFGRFRRRGSSLNNFACIVGRRRVRRRSVQGQGLMGSLELSQLKSIHGELGANEQMYRQGMLKRVIVAQNFSNGFRSVSNRPALIEQQVLEQPARNR